MKGNNVNIMLDFYLPKYKNAEMQDKREKREINDIRLWKRHWFFRKG